MDELLGLLAALFNALTKGLEPASARRPAPLGQALRDALAQRVVAPAGPGATSPAGPPAAPAGRPRSAALQPSAPIAPAPPPPPQSPAAGVSRRAAPPGQAPEAGRVTALFANPQSLVAAFIVAEVLAPPIALRDPLAPPRR
jgi:hypothetical protein